MMLRAGCTPATRGPMAAVLSIAASALLGRPRRCRASARPQWASALPGASRADLVNAASALQFLPISSREIPLPTCVAASNARGIRAPAEPEKGRAAQGVRLGTRTVDSQRLADGRMRIAAAPGAAHGRGAAHARLDAARAAPGGPFAGRGVRLDHNLHPVGQAPAAGADAECHVQARPPAAVPAFPLPCAARRAGRAGRGGFVRCGEGGGRAGSRSARPRHWRLWNKCVAWEWACAAGRGAWPGRRRAAGRLHGAQAVPRLASDIVGAGQDHWPAGASCPASPLLRPIPSSLPVSPPVGRTAALRIRCPRLPGDCSYYGGARRAEGMDRAAGMLIGALIAALAPLASLVVAGLWLDLAWWAAAVLAVASVAAALFFVLPAAIAYSVVRWQRKRRGARKGASRGGTHAAVRKGDRKGPEGS